MWLQLSHMALALGLGLCANGEGPTEKAQKEMEKLQGTWKLLKVVNNGQAVPETELEQYRQVEIVGDKILTIAVNRVVFDNKASIRREQYVLRFTIDPSQRPAAIEVRPEDQKTTVPGIYELEKDTLKICINFQEKAQRPKEFASKLESNNILWILERIVKGSEKKGKEKRGLRHF